MKAALSGPGGFGLAALVAAAALLAPAAPLRAQDTPRKQQIAFAELPERTVGDAPFDLVAKASSGLPVTFAVVDGPAVLDGKRLRLTGTPGLVVVLATQAGNAVFAAAKPEERAFAVSLNPSPPAFTLEPRAGVAEIGSIIVLTAAASGVPAPTFQWRKDGAPIQGATDRALTIAAARRSDAGAYDVLATNRLGTVASDRVQVSVVKRHQFISFQGSTSLTAGQPYALSANASSGLQVRFEVVSGTATLNGGLLTPQAGAVVVQASQDGDATYEAASPVTENFTVNLSPSGQRLP